MRNLTRPTKQRGAAIIVALFVVALVAAAATMMIERLRTDIRRTELTINANTAYLYAQGSVAWAIDQLNNDVKFQKQNSPVDRTPIKASPDKHNGITITSEIDDAQSFFNINNLSDAQYQANFVRLIQVLAPEVDGSAAQNLALNIADWIAAGSKNPALNDYYLKLDPPYRAAHQPMVSISELRLVKGMTPQLFAKLSPYLTALPTVTPISVNNAPIPVLMSLNNALTAESAKAIAAACKQNPFANIQNFSNFDVVKNNPIDANKITVNSNYFLLLTNVTLGQQTLTLYTMLGRSGQGAQVKTIVLWQSKGTQ